MLVMKKPGQKSPHCDDDDDGKNGHAILRLCSEMMTMVAMVIVDNG